MARMFGLFGLASILFVTTPSQAQVSASLGGGTGSFVTLSSTGLNGGTVATLSGGSVLTGDQSYAHPPSGGAIFGDTYLATGRTAGQTATLTFTNPLPYFSFLWGSPELNNIVTITTNLGTSESFTASGLGFVSTNGNQNFSQYVQFVAIGGSSITSASFTNTPTIDSFEVANFNIVRSSVPEPASWVMMLVGIGAAGFSSRRRRLAIA